MNLFHGKVVETRKSRTRVQSSMTEAKRSSGIGHLTLTSFKNIIMTRSARVRDIYLVSTKQKYNQHGIEPEVLEQNNTNLLRERAAQYDIFRAKSAGRDDKVATQLNKNTKAAMGNQTGKNALQSDSKTIDKSSNPQAASKKTSAKAKQTKATCKSLARSESTVFKHLISGDLTKPQGDVGGEFRPVAAEMKAKPNIYETVPRALARSNTAASLEDAELTCRRTNEPLPRAEPKVRTTDIPRGGERVCAQRPQTPKIKKSVEMRNKMKLLSNAAHASFNKGVQTEPSGPPVAEAGSDPERRLRRTPQSRRQRKESARLHLPDQLLHPLWRRIPHRALYGWSEQHQLLETLLHNQIADNQLASPYYTTDEAYTQAQETSGGRFLAKPIVESVSEVLSLLDYYELCPGALPKPSAADSPLTRHTKRWDSGGGDAGSSEDVESGYDADDE